MGSTVKDAGLPTSDLCKHLECNHFCQKAYMAEHNCHFATNLIALPLRNTERNCHTPDRWLDGTDWDRIIDSVNLPCK